MSTASPHRSGPDLSWSLPQELAQPQLKALQAMAPSASQTSMTNPLRKHWPGQSGARDMRWDGVAIKLFHHPERGKELRPHAERLAQSSRPGPRRRCAHGRRLIPAGDNVRLGRGDHVRDPLRRPLPVAAAARVDIVGHDANQCGKLRR